MITVREAQQDDAGQIAPLIDIIFDEMELDELEDVPEPGLAKVITRAYQTDTYLSSKASTVVAEPMAKLLGLCLVTPAKTRTISTRF